MKTALVILFLLVAVLIVCFFRSSHYLKLRLGWFKEDLQNLPNSKESLSLSTEISVLLSGDFTQQQKEKARDLINRSSQFIRKSVPCYGENNEVPSWDQRNDPDFKCARCNEKMHCTFFRWQLCQPFLVGFFLKLKFQPNH